MTDTAFAAGLRCLAVSIWCTGTSRLHWLVLVPRKRRTQPTVKIGAGSCTARELDRLILKLRKDQELVDLVPGECEPDFVPVSEVMLRYPAGWKPWSSLIEAMIWGLVEVRLHREPTKGPMRSTTH